MFTVAVREDPPMRAWLASVLLGCVLHPQPESLLKRAATADVDATGASAYWPGAALSGTWYDPARSGEGVVLQMLPDGSFSAIWFTYPASTEDGEQMWLLGRATSSVDDTLRFDALRPVGARFGAQFDPAQVRAESWGRFEMQFTDCRSARLRWTGPAAFGSGEIALTRFSELDELECSGARSLLANGARSLDGLRARSGAWYVPSRSGEGWLLEEYPDGRVGMYWFTYDEQGRQRWIIGSGTREGTRWRFDRTYLTRGARFGDAFRREDVQIRDFGSVTIEQDSCSAMRLGYVGLDPQHGSAERATQRLVSIAGLPCLDGTPAESGGTRWVERAPLPGGRISEHAAVADGDYVYVVGGFGDFSGFKRYSPAQDSWTVLPPMPGRRHHLEAFASGGAIYAVGGYRSGTASDAPAFRFDPASSSWSDVPELRPSVASHAATLHGRAYLGDIVGTLQEFDPVTRRERLIAPSQVAGARDHSQVVAFMDEIWMLGGRSPEHASVAIYDPASGRWRSGPSMAQTRAGFAAAVVGPRIVVAGGEYLSPLLVIGSAEVYTAGAERFVGAPPLPVPVHGVPGASWRGRFFLVSGSTTAGATSGGTGRMFELELPP
jgi:hypothetical protein